MSRSLAGLGLALLALVMPVSAQEVLNGTLLHNDFEAGAPDWSLTGLWAVDGTPSSMTGGAAYSGSQSLNYNNGVNYNTGGINSGTARTPVFTIRTFGRQTITFRCNYRTETTGSAYDKRIVRVYRADQLYLETTLRTSGSTAPVGGRCSAMGVWHLHTLEIPSIAPPNSKMADMPRPMQIEFAFDTVDGTLNNHPGWFVDNVQVTQRMVYGDDHGDTMQTATEIALGTPAIDTRPLDGRIEPAGDVDFFKFTMPTILRPTVPGVPPIPVWSVEARTFDLSPEMDTVLHLYDANGTELRSNDDAAGAGLASLITFTAAAAGQTYYLKVRHFSSTGTGSYKISVFGQELVTNTDDHGNTPETATLIQPNDPPTAGVIERAGDVDFFQTPQLYFFMDPGPRNWTFETSDLSSSMDTVIDLYASDGTTLLASNDDASGLGLASRITWVATAGTRFYIKVRHYSSTGTGSYKIRVLEQQP